MDLWIRSQDKYNLTIVHSIDIEPYGVDRNEWQVIVNALLFGVYKSYERALEVLDEIQKYIDGKPIMKIGQMHDYEEIKKEFGGSFILTDARIEIVPAATRVYQMPKE